MKPITLKFFSRALLPAALLLSAPTFANGNLSSIHGIADDAPVADRKSVV